MLLEVLERAGGVRESRPVANRASVGGAILVGGRNPPFFSETFVDDAKKVSVELRRRLSLLRRLVTGMSLQDLVTGKRPVRLAREGLQGFDHAAFPIDQRSIAIEGQDFEISEMHFGISFVTS